MYWLLIDGSIRLTEWLIISFILSLCISFIVKVELVHEGRLRATFRTASESWTAVTERSSVMSDQPWQYVEVSWHLDKGAYVHIGKRRSRIVRTHANVSDDDVWRHTQNRRTVYLGSLDQSAHGTVSPQPFQVFVDELEIWFADRDHIKAFGFLEDGRWHQ